MYEGQLAGGFNKWTGYGRWMQLAVAVGWWSGKDRLKGQGITHTGDHFQYQGRWDDSKFFNEPAHRFVVHDLRTQYNETIEAEIRANETAKARAKNESSEATPANSTTTEDADAGNDE